MLKGRNSTGWPMRGWEGKEGFQKKHYGTPDSFRGKDERKKEKGSLGGEVEDCKSFLSLSILYNGYPGAEVGEG